jgi:acetyltransferase
MVHDTPPATDAAPFVIMTRRGIALIIRRVASGDVALLQAFLGQLSERTRSLRYMTARPLIEEGAQQEARRMAGGHTTDQVTLLAIEQASGQIIAVAELVRAADQPAIGEFALVVRDDAQNDGIGSELLQRVVQIASQIGLAQLRATLLSANRPMRALIGKLGSPHTSTHSGGALEIVWRVAATHEAAAQGQA